MIEVFIRCYEELNDHLPGELKKMTFSLEISPGLGVSDLVDSLGIPSGEIDLILVNGKSVPLYHILENRDRISLYPVFEIFDVASVTRLPHAPLRRPAFICDAGLGSLSEYMQGIGLDAWHDDRGDAAGLVELSNAHGRIILTTEKRILKEEGVTRAILLENTAVREQVKQVQSHLDLKETGCKTCAAGQNKKAVTI